MQNEYEYCHNTSGQTRAIGYVDPHAFPGDLGKFFVGTPVLGRPQSLDTDVVKHLTTVRDTAVILIAKALRSSESFFTLES